MNYSLVYGEDLLITIGMGSVMHHGMHPSIVLCLMQGLITTNIINNNLPYMINLYGHYKKTCFS